MAVWWKKIESLISNFTICRRKLHSPLSSTHLLIHKHIILLHNHYCLLFYIPTLFVVPGRLDLLLDTLPSAQWRPLSTCLLQRNLGLELRRSPQPPRLSFFILPIVSLFFHGALISRCHRPGQAASPPSVPRLSTSHLLALLRGLTCGHFSLV